MVGVKEVVCQLHFSRQLLRSTMTDVQDDESIHLATTHCIWLKAGINLKERIPMIDWRVGKRNGIVLGVECSIWLEKTRRNRGTYPTVNESFWVTKLK
jgi:hypothetical protein